MSHHKNDEWLEAAKETFEEAIDSANWALARDIIQDVRSQGFRTEATQLETELVIAYRDDVSEHE